MSRCDHSAMYLKDDEIHCALCDLETTRAENTALRAVLREYTLAHPAHWQYSANAKDLEDRARALLAEGK